MHDVAVAALDTPVGRLTVEVTRAGLAGVSWGRRLSTALPEVDDPDRTGVVLAQLAEYFRGERTRFDLSLDWGVTAPLHRVVLDTLACTVGHGEHITYGELAARSGTGLPARAVGAVMSANPVPVVVPCHRVLASDGLGGYSGGSGRDGLEVKRWLLVHEGTLPPTLC